MNRLQPSVGREHLRRLPELVMARRKAAEFYRGVLGDIEGLGLPYEPPWARSNWQSFRVRLAPRHDQLATMQLMLDAGISARRGIMCSHRERAYADIPVRRPLPHSEQAQDHCILLPLYPSMRDDEQQAVVAALRRVCDR